MALLRTQWEMRHLLETDPGNTSGLAALSSSMLAIEPSGATESDSIPNPKAFTRPPDYMSTGVLDDVAASPTSGLADIPAVTATGTLSFPSGVVVTASHVSTELGANPSERGELGRRRRS